MPSRVLIIPDVASDLGEGAVFAVCFFFFQAEDGIRDRNVTGVQTCALPISWAVDAATTRWKGARPRKRPGTWTRSQIGRASCRERVEIWVGVESGKRKIEEAGRQWSSGTMAVADGLHVAVAGPRRAASDPRY